jgi:3-oxoacyl-(acyl-carrier-protein) synthase
LKDAAIEMPSAIVTGTGFGCLEDTSTFLTKMISQNEEGANPTPFIQSTHNTIGSQVALLLGCHGHNQTFTHQSFSFESALLDARMLLAEDSGQNILVGAVDEITEDSHALMHRAGIFGDKVAHGEGAFYFLCAAQRQAGSYARILNQETFFKPDSIQKRIEEFLVKEGFDPAQIDLVLFGGMDQPWDREASKAIKALFPQDHVLLYKKYCGEFATSAGFAVWLSALLIKNGFEKLDNLILDKPNTIIIYNPYLGDYHSLILLASCPDTK